MLLVFIIIHKQENKKKEVSKIHAHSSQIYDLQFSPFDDNILASGSDGGRIRLWKIPENGLTSDLSDFHADLQEHRKRVSSLRFHPSAENILLSGSNDSTVLVWDIESSQTVLRCELDGAVQGLSWNYDGSLFASTTVSKTISVWDPRSQQSTQQGNGHVGIKPSRCIWLGNSNNIASTGFTRTRERQLCIWDSRNLSSSLTKYTIDSSTGILEPFYDSDTKLLYLAGKGDGNIRCFETMDSSPYYNEITQFVSDQPTKSACLIPKRSVNVMDCEINRILKVTANSIIPIAWNVPRKSKVNFADDLFPNTAGPIPAHNAKSWLDGTNNNPILVSLNPEIKGISESQQEEIKKKEEEERIIKEEEERKANIKDCTFFKISSCCR